MSQDYVSWSRKSLSNANAQKDKAIRHKLYGDRKTLPVPGRPWLSITLTTLPNYQGTDDGLRSISNVIYTIQRK